MVPALLITGDTYLSRRDIKALGGKWYPDQTGWIVPLKEAEEAEKLSAGRNFIVEIIEVEPEAMETPTGERLRAIRQARIDRKAERLNSRADRLEAKSDAEAAKVIVYDDFAFWTQPILVGHHSEKSHRRLRDRLSASMTKSAKLSREAQELRQQATPTKARIAGDAERKRQSLREKNDQTIIVGSRVKSWIMGMGGVVRVNKKTYTVRFDSGGTYAEDKSMISPT